MISRDFYLFFNLGCSKKMKKGSTISSIKPKFDHQLFTCFVKDANAKFVWFDFNNDHLIDLHIINDRSVGTDALYENTGNGSFTDVVVLSESHLSHEHQLILAILHFTISIPRPSGVWL